MKKIAIGWDVRGWRGNQQAVAVLKVDNVKQTHEWKISDDFQFKANVPLSLSSLLMPVLGIEYKSYLSGADKIIIGIDAPLAFSQAFKHLLISENSEFIPTHSQITNPLAFRQCERWIKDEYGKTPLSASFDKLGNGATLAISMAHSLKKEGFHLLPQDKLDSDRAIIEVYPGIHKVKPNRASMAIPPIHQYIPVDCMPGTDQYDAAICAITAAVYVGVGSQFGLPALTEYQADFDPAEGWVYGLPANYVRQYQL